MSNYESILARLCGYARPAGSAQEIEALKLCMGELQALGFECQIHPFSFSQFPGKLITPLSGFALVLAFSLSSSIYLALAIFLLLALLIGVTVKLGTDRNPLFRATSHNLVAQRDSVPPQDGSSTLWVAHVDSKSQNISMFTRVAAVTGAVIAVVILCAGSLVGSHYLVYTATALGVMSSIPLAICLVGSKGKGTLDNASGVATILESARRLPREVPVTIVLTGAEELGLAGATAYLGHLQKADPSWNPLVLNCDTVDDNGSIVCFTSSRLDSSVSQTISDAMKKVSPTAYIRSMVFGILTDSVVFSKAGYNAVTISRGTWNTLKKIHTEADNMVEFKGIGIPETARLITEITTLYTEDKRVNPMGSQTVNQPGIENAF